MKVVDLEEQLDALHKLQTDVLADCSQQADLQRQIASLTQDNERLTQQISKLEELKSSSESFVKTGSNVDSTESFEALGPDDLLKRIDGLQRENGALLEKLTRYEEKGSSDAGSTESFERIPEQHAAEAGSSSRLENLTRENYELVVKLTKLEEKLAAQQEPDAARLQEENERLAGELSLLQESLAREKRSVEDVQTTTEEAEVGPSVTETTARIESLTALNEELKTALETAQLEKEALAARLEDRPTEEPVLIAQEQLQVETAPKEDEAAAIASLESEIERCNALIAEQQAVIDDMKLKLAKREEELERKSTEEQDAHQLRRELEENASLVAEWKRRCAEMEDKIEALEAGKRHIEDGLQALQAENRNLLEQSEHKDTLVASLKEELDQTIAGFDAKLRDQSQAIGSQEEVVRGLRRLLDDKEQELKAKDAQWQEDVIRIDEMYAEVQRLESQVQQREATMALLTEELEALRTNTSVVEEDLFVARHQLTDLHEKLEHTKSLEEYNQVLERLNDSEMLVEELQNKLTQRVAEVKDLRAQAESLAAENQQLRHHLEEEDHKVADLLESNRSQEEALASAERAKAEVENRLMELQATHEEHLRHAKNVSEELQQAYRMLEQVKVKHTEDLDMLNRRLEDALEEVNSMTQELGALQSELDEKNSVLDRCVSDEVKAGLESRVAELEKRLAEAEEKAHAQLEKMKKYAAVAKKKTAQCEELEAKNVELEEKCSLEKSEKEAKNRELQESLVHIQEKDNKIAEVEEELQRAQSERDEALRNIHTIEEELNEAKEQLSALNEELNEMSEAKDAARELGVRMQVMETEYMEQLAQINSLKAENGFLVSKQSQINERLENVEKESDERRAKLEKLEKEKEIAKTQRSEVQATCGQCNSRVQALEAKLQERDAEIENLDNELHNSIGNLVQMQENLRLSTISGPPDTSLQESYNELMQRYNVLTSTNEETKVKYEATLRDNDDLVERIGRLRELNATLQERIDAVEKELTKDKEAVISFENIHGQFVELAGQYEKQKVDLEATQARLHEALLSNEASERNLLSRVELLEREKQNLLQEYEQLKSPKQEEGDALDDAWGALIDVEAQQLQQKAAPVTERQKREVDEEVAKEESPPPLFDASMFGSGPAPGTTDLEQEIVRLREEVGLLNGQLNEARAAADVVQGQLNNEIHQARSTVETLTEELRNLSASRSDLESIVATRDADIAALRGDVSAANEALASVKAEYERLISALEEKSLWIENAESERSNYLSQLEQLTFEKQEVERVINELLFNLSIADESPSSVEKLRSLEIRLNEVLVELDAVRGDNQQLAVAEEVYKKRLIELENEMKTTSDSARIAELENRVARVIGERDILQLHVNDVTRAYEDLKEASSGMKKILDTVTQEKNQLVQQLEALSRAEAPVQEQIQASAVRTEDLTTAGIEWENDEDPWGFAVTSNPAEVEQYVNIPIVPSAEIQLHLKVDELEDKLRELADENAKLVEDGKLAQLKNVKYVKKLKEYKLQLDDLQRQLKSQRSLANAGFGADLDSAIEDELKRQIETLEKSLADAKEENRKVLAEKEGLLRRIDVLTAATERFTEAKEKQDMEVSIWQMRHKELEMRLQQLDFGPETREAASSTPQDQAIPDPKYEEEIKELKDSVEALAAENEELQQLLEENRSKRQASVEETSGQVQDLQVRNAELSSSNEKLKVDYDSLRRQYEQSLMDANDQVQSMRENCELLKSELAERTGEHERTVAELTERLHGVLEEKAQLEQTVQRLEAASSSLDELTELLNARVQEVAGLEEELEREQMEKEQLEENKRSTVQQLRDELSEKQAQLGGLNATLLEKDGEMAKLTTEIGVLRELLVNAGQMDLRIHDYKQEVKRSNEEIESLRERISGYEAALAEREEQLQQSAIDVQERSSQLQNRQELARKLTEAERQAEELSALVAEKEARIQAGEDEISRLQQELHSKQSELDEARSKLEAALEEPNAKKEVAGSQEAVKVEEDLPVFTFGADSSDRELQDLRAELRAKNEEIEHLQYSISEASTTRMIQGLQDNVNALYNEKSGLEDRLDARNREIDELKVRAVYGIIKMHMSVFYGIHVWTDCNVDEYILLRRLVR